MDEPINRTQSMTCETSLNDTCTHETNEDPPLIVHREVEGEPKIGTSFNRDDEAYDFYNAYAVGKGFSIRRHNIRRNKDGKIITREFVCSKHGESDPQSERSLSYRTDCKAFLQIKEKGGTWVITKFFDEHNHEMATQDEKHYLRSNRNIDPANKAIISSMVEAGIGATQTFSYLANEAGGEQNVQFTQEDLNNYIRTKRMTHLEAKDAQSLINHFKREHKADPLFSYHVQVDVEGHMTNFFWRDGRSLLDYECFGDVVIFDTTYRTNKYGMICAPFTGINHHKKKIVFACAFLLDETTETFVWLFKTFLEEMGNRHPVTIFTDQAQAMANAIAEVFPTTKHRLCMWHLSENAGKHLSHQLSIPRFKEDFTFCVYGCISEMEFEKHWSKMISTYDLGDHKWLLRLYELRHKWSPAFGLDKFSAGVRSTQRSESTNSVFRRISCKTIPLVRLIPHVQKVAERWRSKEQKQDFRCKMGKPVHAARNSGILKQAAQVYTITIFKLFKQEFFDTLHLVVTGFRNEGGLYMYSIQQETHTRQFLVEYDPQNNHLTCLCKKFESMGILCSHALKVLNLNGVNHIPAQYLLKRWTKNVKKGTLAEEVVECNQETPKSSLTLMRSKLMLKAYKSINQSMLDSVGMEIAEKHLRAWTKEIEDHVATLNIEEDTSSESDDEDTNDESHVHCPTTSKKVNKVKNPTKRRPVGESNARIKGPLEKKKKAAPTPKLSTQGQGEATPHISEHSNTEPTMYPMISIPTNVTTPHIIESSSIDRSVGEFMSLLQSQHQPPPHSDN